MSVENQLTQLETDITNAYTAIQTKGGTVPQDKNTNNLSTAIGSIPTGTPPPAKGLVFSDYNNDGYPTKAEFVGSWTEIPAAYFSSLFSTSNVGVPFASKITRLVIPDGVTTIMRAAFFQCAGVVDIVLPRTLTTLNGTQIFYYVTADITIPDSFTTWVSYQQFYQYRGTKIVFNGQVPDIPNGCFNGATNVMLYDFSHCTFIPSLYSVVSLGHATGCVIRIPLALSDQTLGAGNGWESQTNWSALTGIVWEVV